MRSCLGEGSCLTEYVDIRSGFFGFLVDRLDDNFLRILVSEKQLLVQLPSNIVHALIIAQYPLRDRLAHLADQALHVKVLEDKTYDSMGKQICGR